MISVAIDTVVYNQNLRQSLRS